MSNYKLVPIPPTPEMVEAAEEAYMPFGDMDLAIRMAMQAAPDVHISTGLTKLEEFTKAAMQGLCANPDLTHTPAVDLGYKAVVYAEATLAELERKNKQPVERDRP